jgi:hypothetical protein
MNRLLDTIEESLIGRDYGILIRFGSFSNGLR